MSSPPATPSIAWIHVGDLHLDGDEAWASRDALGRIVAEVNARYAGGADFVFLPGDNANHGTTEQYRALLDTLAPLDLPWRIIPGDHDFEPGDLAAYEALVPPANRPDAEAIAGFRCLFLDIVSAGAGGPDFRLTMHHRNRLAEELGRAEALGQVPLVFMHAYPGDLAADGETVARQFADGGVAFVDTGHTHYNEILNDTRVLYGATRSTGQIEEGGGRPGYTVVCLEGRVASWRFRELGGAGPHVQIVAPSDLRLVTRPADARQVPRPGPVAIVARVFGGADGHPVTVRVAGQDAAPMIDQGAGRWQAEVTLDDGLHRIEVACGAATDCIELLVRGADAIPKRPPLVAPGQNCHALGAWPAAGLLGTQLGPNRNGGKPS